MKIKGPICDCEKVLLQKDAEMLRGQDNQEFSYEEQQDEHEYCRERDNGVDVVARQLVHCQSLRGVLSSRRNNSHFGIVNFKINSVCSSKK